MGSAVSCRKCTAPSNGSVINLSDALISRVVDGVEVPPTKRLSVSAEDEDWMLKLRGIDDSHSTAYGLHLEDMYALSAQVERRISEMELIDHCPNKQIKSCIRFNGQCTLNCAKEIDDYINCLDAKRLQRLKQLQEKNEKDNVTKIKHKHGSGKN